MVSLINDDLWLHACSIIIKSSFIVTIINQEVLSKSPRLITVAI